MTCIRFPPTQERSLCVEILGFPLVVRMCINTYWQIMCVCVCVWWVDGRCCYTIELRKPRALLSLSRELGRVSEMSFLHLYAADSSILASSPFGTHEIGSSLFLSVPLMFYPGSQRARSGHSMLCNPSVFPGVLCVPPA